MSETGWASAQKREMILRAIMREPDIEAAQLKLRFAISDNAVVRFRKEALRRLSGRGKGQANNEHKRVAGKTQPNAKRVYVSKIGGRITEYEYPDYDYTKGEGCRGKKL